ncbi:MAG: aldo/keto reductase [Eggerthellaceae bacterium]|nr:aldo/keto reductase [Eggerthellaceae bacterium]
MKRMKRMQQMKKAILSMLLLASVLMVAACGSVEVQPESDGSASPSTSLPAAKEEAGNPTSKPDAPEGEKEEKPDVGVFDFDNRSVLLNSGFEMPIVGLGTYSLDYDTCVNSVKALLESGGRLIDTAYMYHNEDAVGEGVRQAMEEYGIPRDEIFVITKIYPSQFDDPEAAIEMALEKLDLDYIDMMLLHHPGTGDVAAYQAMEKYVESGKIRSLGLSNWYVEELEEFLPQVTIMPALVQNESHPY